MDQSRLGDAPFHATIEGTEIGNLVFTKFALSNLRAATTPQILRHENNKTDYLFMSMVLTGSVRAQQNDYSGADCAGDFAIRDTNTPWTIEHGGYSEVLAIQIPRVRLETMLGSARHFSGLTVGGNLPTTTLTRSFLDNLLRVGDRLAPEAAERMVSAGIDLVVASLAERMAMETPKALLGTLIVQRAMTYVAANFSDPDLTSSQVASAVGVSLRHLQELFRGDGRNISAWIWQLRLEKAALRLSDPASSHLQVGEVAYRCGFVDQAHFSRRFRDRYAVSPRDYRQGALTRAAAAAS